MTKPIDLAAIGHELRTPLNGVLGILELLSLTKLDHEQRRLMDSAAASGRMLQGLLADFLDFSRFESHGVPLRLSRFFPERLVRDVSALLARDAGERGISFECHVTPRVPHALLGDSLRIQQVLINLVANAIKFTERGFVKLSIDAETLPGRCVLQVSVEDSGVGIPAEQIDRIFEPFHQAGNAERIVPNQRRGVGLGLAITRRLVDAMQGEIRVESHPGIGSTFRVSLPLEISEDVSTDTHSLENLSAHVASHSTAAVSLPPLTALVADDNPVNCFLLDRQLQRLGCHVLVCETGDEALELWTSERPALLFTDLHMPGLSGLGLVRAIREIESEAGAELERERTAAFLVSAAQSPEISVEAIAAGFDGSLPKPLRFQDLARAVNTARESATSTPTRPGALAMAYR